MGIIQETKWERSIKKKKMKKTTKKMIDTKFSAIKDSKYPSNKTAYGGKILCEH